MYMQVTLTGQIARAHKKVVLFFYLCIRELKIISPVATDCNNIANNKF